MNEYEIKFVDAHCDKCEHFKSYHLSGIGCMACAYIAQLVMEGKLSQGCAKPMCQRVYDNWLHVGEMEQAKKVPATMWAQEMPCLHCGELWMAHTGALCPNMATTFEPLIGEYDPAFTSG